MNAVPREQVEEGGFYAPMVVHNWSRCEHLPLSMPETMRFCLVNAKDEKKYREYCLHCYRKALEGGCPWRRQSHCLLKFTFSNEAVKATLVNALAMMPSMRWIPRDVIYLVVDYLPKFEILHLPWHTLNQSTLRSTQAVYQTSLRCTFLYYSVTFGYRVRRYDENAGHWMTPLDLEVDKARSPPELEEWFNFHVANATSPSRLDEYESDWTSRRPVDLDPTRQPHLWNAIAIQTRSDAVNEEDHFDTVFELEPPLTS